MTNLSSISTILISSSIDRTLSYLAFLLLLWALELDLIAAQQLVLTWQLRDVGLLCMRNSVTCILWSCIFFGSQVRIIEGSDNRGWTVLGLPVAVEDTQPELFSGHKTTMKDDLTKWSIRKDKSGNITPSEVQTVTRHVQLLKAMVHV